MQKFLRISFGIFTLGLLIIGSLFISLFSRDKEEMSTEAEQKEFAQLSRDLPLNSIALQLEKTRNKVLTKKHLSHRSLDEFDILLLRQTRRVSEQLEQMNPGEAWCYLNNLLRQSTRSIQDNRSELSEVYYHLKLIEVVRKEGQLLTSLHSEE